MTTHRLQVLIAINKECLLATEPKHKIFLDKRAEENDLHV